jgi:hypothetical protein
MYSMCNHIQENLSRWISIVYILNQNDKYRFLEMVHSYFRINIRYFSPDKMLFSSIHEALAQPTLLPSEHFLDAGYVDADLLVTSQNELGIEVIGPVRPDSRGPGPS